MTSKIKCDIELEMVDLGHAAGLHCVYSFNCGLLSEAFITMLHKHLVLILACLIEDVDSELDAIQCLPLITEDLSRYTIGKQPPPPPPPPEERRQSGVSGELNASDDGSSSWGKAADDGGDGVGSEGGFADPGDDTQGAHFSLFASPLSHLREPSKSFHYRPLTPCASVLEMPLLQRVGSACFDPLPAPRSALRTRMDAQPTGSTSTLFLNLDRSRITSTLGSESRRASGDAPAAAAAQAGDSPLFGSTDQGARQRQGARHVRRQSADNVPSSPPTTSLLRRLMSQHSSGVSTLSGDGPLHVLHEEGPHSGLIGGSPSSTTGTGGGSTPTALSPVVGTARTVAFRLPSESHPRDGGDGGRGAVEASPPTSGSLVPASSGCLSPQPSVRLWPVVAGGPSAEVLRRSMTGFSVREVDEGGDADELLAETLEELEDDDAQRSRPSC
ncbi:hypothetical protein FOA52_009589 [Chlamydomonas sp. UWO 241]|nr:hypothetical protein FOA52_009589 [Chlamydomonas sp. UWO 241]